jgi:hypothetical protein
MCTMAAMEKIRKIGLLSKIGIYQQIKQNPAGKQK